MESVYLLVPVSVILVFLIAYIFWWAVRSGQFDDLEGPAYKIIMNEDRPNESRPDNSGAKKDQKEGGSKEA